MTQQSSLHQPQRGRQLDVALANARQSLALLLSQLRAQHFDPAYLVRRLESLNQLLEQLADERRNVGQQQHLAALYDVSRLIGSSLDLQTVLDQVMVPDVDG